MIIKDEVTMVRQAYRFFILFVSVAAFCGSLLAQTGKTFTIRILDGKSGKPVAASGYLIRVNHDSTIHANWVEQKVDGTAKLTLPPYVTVVSIQASYDSSMAIFINCDPAQNKGKDADYWYTVSEIATTGIIAPNACGDVWGGTLHKKKVTAKPVPKPGELVFFVRKETFNELLND